MHKSIIERKWLMSASAMALYLAFNTAHAGFIHDITMPKDASITASDDRQYSIYIPSTYQAGKAVPLVVVLHGCRQTHRTMTDLGRMEELAERDKFIVLYPFQNNPQSTNDNDMRNPNCWGYWKSPELHRGGGEVADIKRMVDKVKSQYTIDPYRVHITGISSGGAMANIAAVAYPDVFTSAAIVEGIGYNETASTYTGTYDCAGVLNGTYNAVNKATSTMISDMRTEMKKSVLRQVPVMIIHNKKDCIVPISVANNNIAAWAGLMSAEGKSVNTGSPTFTGSYSTDGLPWVHSKYGAASNGQSLIETVILDASEQQLRAAGVQPMSEDVYEPSSNTIVKEDISRGHWWSGAKRGPWVINKGPNTSDLAWNFFKVRALDGSIPTVPPTNPPPTDPPTNPPPTDPPTNPPPTTPVQTGDAKWTAANWGTDAVHGSTLSGYVYWPKSQPLKAGKRALIVVLHGCSQTASGDVIPSATDDGFNWTAVAEQYGAVIAAPNATGNVQYLHCWEYYGTQSRTTGHVPVLLDMVSRLKADTRYSIDPNQVYVTGLSSGGGQTMVMGCVAPEIFAGIGINAGPTVGTTSGQIGSLPAGYTATTAKTNCQNFAGSNSGQFATQITSVVYGTSDGTVGQVYGQTAADAMNMLYSSSTTPSTFTVTGGGSGKLYKDGQGRVRTSLISVSGMSHAWPAGSGGQNSNYVDGTKVNYPQYVTKFWFDNNLRAGGGTTNPPTDPPPTNPPPSTGWTESASGTVTQHYTSGRITATQYTTLGAKYGYTATVTLYKCSSGWTDSATCDGSTPTNPPPTTGYTETASDTVTNHYSAQRITLTQYTKLGIKYGYIIKVTLYKCSAGWTDSPTCAPL